MNANNLIAIAVGIIIGMIFEYGANQAVRVTAIEAGNLIKACELELPRNQYCELTAVPKVE